jgi:hypothetical protein
MKYEVRYGPIWQINRLMECLAASELLTPHPLSSQRVCPPPHQRRGGGGTHSPGGEGGGGGGQ